MWAGMSVIEWLAVLLALVVIWMAVLAVWSAFELSDRWSGRQDDEKEPWNWD